MVINPNLPLLEAVVERLGKLSEHMVFVGGCAVGLLVTDPAAPCLRVTHDVDVLVEVATLAGYHRLSEELRRCGFNEDMDEGAPICRWRTAEVVLDVMPTEPSILGFGNRWFEPAYSAAKIYILSSGKQIRLPTAPFLLATKFEAFDFRGERDYLLSRDMEDIVSVLDGRPEIMAEVHHADNPLRLYLAQRFASLLETRNFFEALPGLLPPDAASQSRATLIINRIESMARTSQKGAGREIASAPF